MVATTCLGMRRAVSLALDSEASSRDVAGLVSHLLGCEPCCRFAGAAAELSHYLRAAPLESPGMSREIEASRGEQS